MFTVSSTSAPIMPTRLLYQANRDMSAHPIWYAASSGLEFSLWRIIEHSEMSSASTGNALKLPDDVLPIKALPNPVSVFTPKTELASRLWEIRKRITATGEPLLDWDDIQKEVSLRRSERG
ncbi:MAG: hypothetical protein AB1894_03805 [Chloroflexota bacterium]